MPHAQRFNSSSIPSSLLLLHFLLCCCFLLLLAGCKTPTAREPDTWKNLSEVELASLQLKLPGLLNGMANMGYVKQVISPKENLGWNLWFSNDGSSAPIAPGSMKLDHFYRIRFQLSAMYLSAMQPDLVNGVPASKQLSQLLERANREGLASLRFYAVITPADPERLEIKRTEGLTEFSIDLAKLQEFLDKNKAADPLLEQELFKRIQAANIAEFSFRFNLRGPGAQKASVMIFDRETGAPVQVIPIEIGNSSNLGFAPDSTPVINNTGAPAADLSLVLHDLSSIHAAAMVAVLAVRDPQNNRYELLSWNTGEDMATLKSALGRFRDESQAHSKAELKKVGWDFGKLIFNPRLDESLPSSKESLDTAARGRAAVLAAMAHGDHDPPKVMLVRLVSSDPSKQGDYYSPTLPIGAMALGSSPEDATFLADRLILSLLLPGQSLATTPDCPGNWYVTQPPASLAAQTPLGKARDAATQFWTFAGQSVVPQSPSLSELNRWLSDSKTPGQSVVFAYLGHNSPKSGFYMEEKQGKITPFQIRRNFGPGSVAILDACETGTDEIGPSTPIGRLAGQKVAATIATMAPVEGYVAAAYMNCMSDVLGKKNRMTVGDLHFSVTNCMSSDTRYHYESEVLKYFLVGNPFQHICSPGVVQ